MNAMHLSWTRTDRGFLHMPPLPDAYEEDAVRVLEASTARSPHIWLRLKDHPNGDPVVLLSAEQAWQLKEQVEYLLEHHYQGDARPESER